MLHAFYMAIFLSSSRLVPFATFLLLVLWSGQPLTADKVFFAISAYNTLTHILQFLVPGAIRGASELRVSLQRLQVTIIFKLNSHSLTSFKSKMGKA